jgi:hypothetical protein
MEDAHKWSATAFTIAGMSQNGKAGAVESGMYFMIGVRAFQFFQHCFFAVNRRIIGHMESIVHNVRDLEAGQRKSLELVVGQPLRDNQQIVIQVRGTDSNGETVQTALSSEHGPTCSLPDWCDVYAGLSEKELADVEKAVTQRADMTRSSSE